MTREEAKKAFEEDLPKVSQFSPKMASAYKVAISDLSANKGEWIKDHEVDDVAENVWYTVYRCSECGCLVESWKQSNFCPNCGADMRK